MSRTDARKSGRRLMNLCLAYYVKKHFQITNGVSYLTITCATSSELTTRYEQLAKNLKPLAEVSYFSAMARVGF